MIGFIIGTVCLVALIATIRRGRYGHCGGGGGWGQRWGGHGWGQQRGCGGGGGGGWGGPPWARGGGDHHEGGPGFGGGGRGGWGGPQRFFLRMLFERLETTPGQERVIMTAADEMREAIAGAKGSIKESRVDVAKAVRSEGFDAEHLGAVFHKHDEAVDNVRKAAVSSLAKVHEALDDKQRKVLADLIESGPRFFGGGWGRGPYRGGSSWA